MRIVPTDRKQSSLPGLPGIIDALGSDRFSSQWAGLIRESCGAVYVSAFRIQNGHATVVVSDGPTHPDIASDHARRYADGMHWRHDPVLALAGTHGDKNSTVLVQLDPNRIKNSVLKHNFYHPASICDKLAISASKDNSLFIVSLLHTVESGRFTKAAVDRISGLADMLVAVLAKHAALMLNTVAENQLASVAAIEARLLQAQSMPIPWRLTTRERQVCARILFGMTAAGIAIDLGINEYSVDTYRKRAYARLGAATRHDLLRRYLSLDGPQQVASILPTVSHESSILARA